MPKLEPTTDAALSVVWLWVEPIDPRADNGLEGGRNSNLGCIRVADVAAACSLEYPAFGEVADHLLREKWVTGGSHHDRFPHLADRGVRAEQLGN
jgi:hypothetical protein